MRGIKSYSERVAFIGGRVNCRPMPSTFKAQAKARLLARLQAYKPDAANGGPVGSDWSLVWAGFEQYGGFYYAYGILAYVLRTR